MLFYMFLYSNLQRKLLVSKSERRALIKRTLGIEELVRLKEQEQFTGQRMNEYESTI